MKLKKTLFIILFISIGIFANTLNDITSLIEQMKSVEPSERYELMNEIKSNIISLNEADRSKALNQMRQSRQKAKYKKLSEMKASLTPEQLIAFEEKVRLRRENKIRYKEAMSKARENPKYKSEKQLKNINYKKNNPRKQMTQDRLNKIKSELNPEQLNKYSNKIKYYQNLINNIERTRK